MKVTLFKTALRQNSPDKSGDILAYLEDCGRYETGEIPEQMPRQNMKISIKAPLEYGVVACYYNYAIIEYNCAKYSYFADFVGDGVLPKSWDFYLTCDPWGFVSINRLNQTRLFSANGFLEMGHTIDAQHGHFITTPAQECNASYQHTWTEREQIADWSRNGMPCLYCVFLCHTAWTTQTDTPIILRFDNANANYAQILTFIQHYGKHIIFVEGSNVNAYTITAYVGAYISQYVPTQATFTTGVIADVDVLPTTAHTLAFSGAFTMGITTAKTGLTYIPQLDFAIHANKPFELMRFGLPSSNILISNPHMNKTIDCYLETEINALSGQVKTFARYNNTLLDLTPACVVCFAPNEKAREMQKAQQDILNAGISAGVNAIAVGATGGALAPLALAQTGAQVAGVAVRAFTNATISIANGDNAGYYNAQNGGFGLFFYNALNIEKCKHDLNMCGYVGVQSFTNYISRAQNERFTFYKFADGVTISNIDDKIPSYMVAELERDLTNGVRIWNDYAGHIVFKNYGYYNE